MESLYRTSVLVTYVWWRRIYSACFYHNPVLSSFMTYQRICNKSNITGATRGTGTAYPVSAHEFTPVFGEVRVARSLVFCIMLCRSLFGFFGPFSSGHCIVCPSNCGFWYNQTCLVYENDDLMTVNVDKNISNKPCQCPNTGYWADDTLGD